MKKPKARKLSRARVPKLAPVNLRPDWTAAKERVREKGSERSLKRPVHREYSSRSRKAKPEQSVPKRGGGTQSETKLSSLPRYPEHDREFRNFLRMKPRLLENPELAGKFVAVLGGKVVDSDVDMVALMRRVWKKHPNSTPYFNQVRQKETIMEFPPPREYAGPYSIR